MVSPRITSKLAVVAAAVIAAPLIWIATTTNAQAATVPTVDWLHTRGNQIVDESGNPVRLSGTNWFGFNATERVFHGLWSANLTEITKSMADRGINIVRVPISTQLLLEWKAGQAAVPSAVNTYANPELAGKTNLEVFDAFLALCERFGMKVVLDVHSAEADNSGHLYPVWWKGSITSEQFYQAWEWVTARYRINDTLVAMDVKNEPHGKMNESPRATWDSSADQDNFKTACQVAGRRILAINPNVLIMCEGIEIYPKDGTNWSSTAEADYYFNWWGGNLRGAKDHPVDLGANQDQLVYSPHDYGPLVFNQPWFDKPFDKASLTADVWTPNWLYLHDSGTAPLLIGEWGGRLGQDPRQDKWMTALRDLIVEKGLHQTFWVLNPNSGDTGGLLLDDWKTWDEQKYALLRPALWEYQGKFVSLDHQVRLGGAGSTTSLNLAERYGTSGPTDPPTSPSSPPPNDPPPSPPVAGCTATFRTVGSWSGGFQAEVTVRNTGTGSSHGTLTLNADLP
ncbi:cellulase family glycosylhydrolase [Couchioplanes caeruleus]|uniref:Endoglucanase n=1 Tax=Couchioplanes caeruleus TaxID=56438 RepID=A0A3N1GGK4_9ACTN|nr:cellulase family glycosylhydrolase [Couchioplanes caeruleus]ROP29399.1 aryl-phospho-beta-D-glucosidase BglC (GH1 family) [Couchioplanes caeruleus]